MMDKVWSSREEVAYCFSRSSIKFQGRRGQKIADFDPNWAFVTVTQVWLQGWLRNDAQSLMWYRRGALLFSKVIHQIPKSHRIKYRQFRPEWSVNLLTVTPVWIHNLKFTDLKWCTKLDVVQKKCPIGYWLTNWGLGLLGGPDFFGGMRRPPNRYDVSDFTNLHWHTCGVILK